jgi:hypothetical protein
MTATLQIAKQKCRGSLSSTFERVMGLEPTISCLGSKRSTTELHPHGKLSFLVSFRDRQEFILPSVRQFYRLHRERQGIFMAKTLSKAS